jgi:hypothetical protein
VALYFGSPPYDEAGQSAKDRNANVRHQNMPRIQVWAVNLQHTSPNKPGEQTGCCSGHGRRKDGASAQYQPKRHGGKHSDWGARPNAGPRVSPEISLMLKLEQDCDHDRQRYGNAYG